MRFFNRLILIIFISIISGCFTKPTPQDSIQKSYKGKEVFENRGCFACHSVDGRNKVGPTFKGLWGKTQEMSDGSKIIVDERYVRESIIVPNKKIVKGFPPVNAHLHGNYKKRRNRRFNRIH